MSPPMVGLVVAVAVLLAGSPWVVARAPRRVAGGAAAWRGPDVAARRWSAGARSHPAGRVHRRRVGRLDVDVLDPAFVLDLCAAAVRGGAAVPTALVATGRHLPGAEGQALVHVGTALGLGASWQSAWAGVPPSVAALGRALDAGRGVGASPGPQLRAAAARLRRERRARVRVAAGALGVRLTLPLGLCFLPAFVLLGLVPVVVGLAGDLLGGGR
ncbi:type II secretion system F family protein [Cellulomonas wangleii]|nr:type II secretion system F family protein [Cellulomonas wangleii]